MDGERRGRRGGRVRMRGEGRAWAVPDHASIQAGVETIGASAVGAMQAASERIASVLAALREGGVPDRAVRTERVQVHVDWRTSNKAEGRRRYRARNALRVAVAPDRLGAVLDLLVSAGANEMHGVSLEVREPGPALEAARRAAFEDAHAKATAYAAAAGLALGPVLRMEEAEGHGVMYAGAASARSADVPVALGERDVTASVVVTWALEAG